SGWSSNGLSGSGLPLYGYNGGSNIVELTQSVGHQASGTFYQAPVYVGGFLATWTYQVVNPFGTIADGMAFVVQNDSRGAAALGDTTFQTGGSLGYGAPGAITNSVALEFDIFTNATGGAGIALDSNGAIGPNTSTAPVDLGSGDPINVALQYLNGRATVTLFDTVNSNTFTTNALVNVPAIVGGQQAFVGFTAADGGAVSTQTVSNFVYISLVDLQATPSGSNLILAWPVGVGGFTLQQSPALLSGNWTPVTNAVNVVNGSNQVVVPITGNYNFYRLVNP
ncbi:MAG TPA: hypothetical protein VFB72_21085, partial [Verrucomicrobiae bacterium]|nr:hypothetical protein [Verrucomicrobiae bacterium]